MSFFHKKMSQNLWATNMPFAPVTLIFYRPKFFFSGTVHMYSALPRSIAPRFIAKLAYCQNSRLSRFPPLQIPCYTAKLSYRHPPQLFTHKSRKTNLNSPVSTAHNYLLTAVY